MKERRTINEVLDTIMGDEGIAAAHYKNSNNCYIKTGKGYTDEEIKCMKYNGAKESNAHKETREMIGKFLHANGLNGSGVSNVIVDEICKSKPLSKTRRKLGVSVNRP